MGSKTKSFEGVKDFWRVHKWGFWELKCKSKCFVGTYLIHIKKKKQY